MALSMMIPGLFAGALQEAVGYGTFFLIVVVACTMTYVVTSLLKIVAKKTIGEEITDEEAEELLKEGEGALKDVINDGKEILKRQKGRKAKK